MKEDAEISTDEDLYASAESTESEDTYADDNIVSGSASSSDEDPAPLEGNNNFDYYYRALGGESVRHIAFALYSNTRAAKTILSMNDGLSSATPVPSDTKVYFDMEKVSPRAELLTKDLIDRYGSELSEKLRTKRSGQFGNEEWNEVTVEPGDTLQAISERIYGTTRLWTEIYLLNQDKMKNYDSLRVGMVLKYFPKTDYKPPVVIAKAEVKQPEPEIEEPAYTEEEVMEDPTPQPKGANMDVDVADQVGADDPFADKPAKKTVPIARVKDKPEPVTQAEVDAFKDDIVEDSPKVAPKPAPVKNVARPKDSPARSGGVVRGGIPVESDDANIETGIDDKDAAGGGTLAKVTPTPTPKTLNRPKPFMKKPPKQIRPPARKAQAEESGFFGQGGLKRLIYLGLALFILVGGYFLTRPSRGFKKSKFGGIQPMPTPKAAAPRPRAAPAPRNRGSASPPQRPNQRTGS